MTLKTCPIIMLLVYMSYMKLIGKQRNLEKFEKLRIKIKEIKEFEKLKYMNINCSSDLRSHSRKFADLFVYLKKGRGYYLSNEL